MHSFAVARAQKSLRAWKRYTPPWTPRLAPEELNKDGSVKRQPLSHFYKQLPEQIGFFILREVQGLGPREVSAYARSVRSERAAWPAPEDGRVRLVSSWLPRVRHQIAAICLLLLCKILFTPPLCLRHPDLKASRSAQAEDWPYHLWTPSSSWLHRSLCESFSVGHTLATTFFVIYSSTSATPSTLLRAKTTGGLRLTAFEHAPLSRAGQSFTMSR